MSQFVPFPNRGRSGRPRSTYLRASVTRGHALVLNRPLVEALGSPRRIAVAFGAELRCVAVTARQSDDPDAYTLTPYPNGSSFVSNCAGFITFHDIPSGAWMNPEIDKGGRLLLPLAHIGPLSRAGRPPKHLQHGRAG